MAQIHADTIAHELGIRKNQVLATLKLLADGATIPFMARYRKEVTGNLDEVQLGKIRDRQEQLIAMDKRRESILKSLEERDLLTPELEKSIHKAHSLTELEDIYLPYRPKRRTRATIAKEKGLEPLAKKIFEQRDRGNPEDWAMDFIDEGKGVTDAEEALKGARDIMAEWINENKEARERMRHLFQRTALVKSKLLKGKEEEGKKYRDYFDWEEPLSRIPSHRMLALRRAEKELILSLSILPDEGEALYRLGKQFVHSHSPASDEVERACEDCYKRLMSPSIETEIRMLAKEKADQEAIEVFADNLRQLLLAAPLGQKRTLALDPGFRTGCKVVCLDEQGKLLENATIYPHPPQNRKSQSEMILSSLVDKHKIEIIAVGNGTASRETESFVNGIPFSPKIPVVMVNEAGASIYSASEIAREEFPDHDVTVRGAISIGRRLMDPLAELVKIDAKSIGVGQYQHDVDQNQLKKALDDTVMSCVNGVGVELNTASQQLLTYVSGLGPSLAQNIVEYRTENGAFKSRADLKKVPRLGPKAFEQAAGFLRIRGAKNPLDASAVHPESYSIVKQMAKDMGVKLPELMENEALAKKINLQAYTSDSVGLPTLKDILSELSKPGRDPREKFELFSFDERVNEIEDLQEGMVLPGIVTNITNFGAFVDVGVHQDGLVHLSQLANRFIKHPSEVVKVYQKVQVRVISVDVERRRINLSMKLEEERPRGRSNPKHRPRRN